jgi:hypothetical protein
MDAYRKFRGLNAFNQGLEVWAGLHFLLKEGLQIIEGKNFNQIINESVETNTLAYTMLWLDWRQAKEVVNCIEDRINFNSKIIDEFKKLEKNNSTSS